MNELTHLDLFSGLGSWAIAARANGLRTIAFCEQEEWLAKGLERIWNCPCHRDVKTFPAQDYRGVFLLTGSPPCQPASLAGKRRGAADDRWLWPETVKVCKVIQPTWFIFENPPGIDGVGLDGIVLDLEGIGYEVALLRIPACAVNSPQLRDRFWIVGHAIGITIGRESRKEWEKRCQNGHSKPTQSGTVADGEASGQPTGKREECSGRDESLGLSWRDYEWTSFNDSVYRAPVDLYSLADGVTARIPRKFRAKLIGALGNAIVWQVASQIIASIINVIE